MCKKNAVGGLSRSLNPSCARENGVFEGVFRRKRPFWRQKGRSKDRQLQKMCNFSFPTC